MNLAIQTPNQIDESSLRRETVDVFGQRVIGIKSNL